MIRQLQNHCSVDSASSRGFVYSLALTKFSTVVDGQHLTLIGLRPGHLLQVLSK